MSSTDDVFGLILAILLTGYLARHRRRRLRHQAVRDQRAPGPAPGGVAPGRTGRRGAGGDHRALHCRPWRQKGVAVFSGDAQHPGGEVRLTPTEWHIVEMLVRHRGKLVSQRQLLQEVWGPQYSSETNYLRLYLAQIRRKLEPDPSRPRSFLTEPGMGYRFEPGDSAGTAPQAK